MATDITARSGSRTTEPRSPMQRWSRIGMVGGLRNGSGAF
jgi:hypothetical protein